MRKDALLAGFSGLSSTDRDAGPSAAAVLSLLSKQEENELGYAVGRLVKGAASGRPEARENFFSTLTVLLETNCDIAFADVFQVLKKELQIGGQSKSELGEICIGHVLVCGAIVRSGLFMRSTDEEKSELIADMFVASDKKTYLGLTAHYFLCDFIKKHTEEEVKANLWPYIRERLTKPIVQQDLDSLYCLLVLSENCPSLSSKFFKKTFGVTSLFSEEAASHFAEKLMVVPEFSYINHPVYEVLGKQIAKSEHMIEFWSNGIEKKLNTHNENRVLVVLTVLGEILQNVSENFERIPLLLGDKFVPCILEWFKGFQSALQSGKKFKGKSKHSLYESKGKQIMIKAKQVFDILVDKLKQSDVKSEVRLEVLLKLLFSPGDIMFCDITNSKIIRLLIEELDADSVQSLAKTLKKVVTNESKKLQYNRSERFWTNSERSKAAEMLTNLINHKTTIDKIKWRIKQMQFLVMIGLFKSTGCADSHVSSELAVAVRKCFFRSLSFKFAKLEILLKILRSLIDYIDEYISNENTTHESTLLRPEVIESWKAIVKFVKALENREDNETSKANMVFQILALHCGLFLFSDIMKLDAVQGSFKEVQSCYDHYKKDDVKKISKEHNDGDIVEDEPEWIEVLVDVFLNFLSRDSFLLRNVVECVFRLLCDFLTASAIGQLLSVLDPDDETNILSQKDDDSIELSDTENNIENDDDEEESESEESEADEDSATVNDQLRLAVQKALGSAGAETDTESVDLDKMDEEEGNRIDKSLSDAFKLLKQSKGVMSKKEKKTAKTLMEFRIRVIDLLLIYLEKNPSMEVCLGMISPLFKCLESTIKDSAQKQLEDRVRRCLKCLTNIKNFSSTEGVTLDVLADYLTSIISRGNRTQFMYQALGDVISKCGTFIVRCSQKLQCNTSAKKKRKQATLSALVNIYKDSLESFFTKRDCLLPVIFFQDVLQIRWLGDEILLDTIVEKAFDNSVRPFRRNEGLEMINMFYQSIKRNVKADMINSTLNLKPFEEKFSLHIISAFETTNDSKTLMTERFFAILLKTLNTIKVYHNFSKCLEQHIDWEKIVQQVQSFRKTIKLKKNTEYFKFCNLFNVEKLKNEKIENGNKCTKERESVDSGHESNMEEDVLSNDKVKKDKKKTKVVNGDHDANSNKSHSRKMAKEISKKQSKQLRALASSEGLENFSFATLLQDTDVDINQITEEPEITIVKKEKKKRKLEDITESTKIQKISIIP